MNPGPPDLAALAQALLWAVVAANAAGAVALCLLQLWLVWPTRHRRRPVAARAPEPAAAFVSVHLATHSEPPRLVIATLERLAALRGPAFEVVIVDNNTADPALWQPVAAAAARLGERFRFHHRDGVVGAKAGALNIALTLTDPRATHVAVVDADYQVHPDFLTDALGALGSAAADYVQFPQAYRHVSSAACGVEQELGDYFACFAGGAGQVGTMLLTGTLSVIRLDALRHVGGWSPATITEDAELGLRMQVAGCRGIWLPQERGNGLLPLDLAGLRTQRARWVAGNVQVLRRALARRSLRFSAANVLTLFAQLTAWVSLWLIPAAALVLTGLWPTMRAAAGIGETAALTILLSAALTAARMRLALPVRKPLRVWTAALVAKLALSWTAAIAWLPALVDGQLVFHRTRKDGAAAAGSVPPALVATSLLFAGLAGVDGARGDWPAALACLLLAAIWPCALAVDAALRDAARLLPTAA